MSARTGLGVLTILAVWIGLAAGAAAQSGAHAGSRSTEREGWHIVRPGDTLHSVARDYLGSEERWPELLQLNPQIRDPDVIVPAQRIRVRQAPPESVPTALVSGFSGRAQQRPAPISWTAAERESLLRQEDGVRTGSGSSLEMVFLDGTTVVLTEDSVVYLRPGGRARRGDSRAVEIVDGQAEVETGAEFAAGSAVELIVGPTRASSEPDDTGVAQMRARRAADATKVMVYEGSGAVVNAGATVELPRGTGSSVPEDAPPSPAEELLPASKGIAPAAGSRWNYPDPPFSWQPVAGAAGYTLEICLDATCRRLVRRVVGVEETGWRGAPLPVARLHWRVTAVSPSGLDGYPSETLPFDILSDRLDAEPPRGAVTLVGSKRRVGEREVWGADARVEVEVSDEISGVASWSATINGREVEPEALAGPWRSGSYTVVVTAVDRADNRAELAPLRFQVDVDGPVAELRVGSRELLREAVGGALGSSQSAVVRALPPWVARQLRSDRRGPWWTVLAWGREDSPLGENYLPRGRLLDVRAGFRQVTIEGARPQLVLGAPGLELEVDGERRRLTGDDILWLAVSDAQGPVRILSVSERPASGRAPPALVMEAMDEVGNRTELVWDFVAGGPAPGR